MPWGLPIRSEIDGFGVLLRPLAEQEIDGMLPLFNSGVVHEWTLGRYAQTAKSEREWFDRVSSDKNSCQWAIVPDGTDIPVGVTGIHDMKLPEMSGTTGVIIWNREWWGKGVAKRAHLGRTWWAAFEANMTMLDSIVMCPNQASKRALESVGYMVWGVEPAHKFRKGRYWDCYRLKWFNPLTINHIYPRGRVPEQYRAAIKKAEQALKHAREVVKYV